MSNKVLESGPMTRLTADGEVKAAGRRCALRGFYVNSTGGGTLVLKNGGAAGTAMTGTITPGIGYHPFPGDFPNGCYADITGAIDITFFHD